MKFIIISSILTAVRSCAGTFTLITNPVKTYTIAYNTSPLSYPVLEFNGDLLTVTDVGCPITSCELRTVNGCSDLYTPQYLSIVNPIMFSSMRLEMDTTISAGYTYQFCV